MGKRRLGRGIDALLEGHDATESNNAPTIENVSIDTIVPNPNQPRKRFDEARLHELSNSIREKGLIQPIVVEPWRNAQYVIIAGERRYRAAILAGLEIVPVIQRHFNEEEKLEIVLIENLQREDLNPIEEANAFRELIERCGLTQEELSKRIGISRPAIANALRLLRLPASIRGNIESGEISGGHARALLSVNNNETQAILAEQIRTAGLSVRETERRIASLHSDKRSSPTRRVKSTISTKSVELKQLEDQLLERLGTKVSIKGDHTRGSIAIHYYSLDDLERIVNLIDTRRRR